MTSELEQENRQDLFRRLGRLEEEIERIRARNNRVELDKAWETSFFRRTSITILTYVVTAIVFLLISVPYFWLSALIPTVGYVLSTLTLPVIKTYWSKRQHRQE